MRVIDRGCIGRIKRHGLARNIRNTGRNFEWRDRRDLALSIHKWLVKTWCLLRSLRIEPYCTRKGTEVEIERAILLKENEDILDLLA